MKTNGKTTLWCVLLGALMMSTLQSCKKYQDGPAFSLRSRTERVANTWKIDNAKKNGNDYTSFVTGYTETYSKSGVYSYTGVGSATGTWTFQNDQDEILITAGSKTQTFVILKLEEKVFWYYYLDGTDKYEFHMVEN